MKALTPAMIEMLMDCHERELQQQEPCSGISKTQVTKGLLTRGLLRAGTFTNKMTGRTYLGYFITEPGKAYLAQYLEQ